MRSPKGETVVPIHDHALSIMSTVAVSFSDRDFGRERRNLAFRSVDDPQHWRDRAKEMRALLDELTDGKVKAAIIRLADDYDRLAVRAEERAFGMKNSSIR